MSALLAACRKGCSLTWLSAVAASMLAALPGLAWGGECTVTTLGIDPAMSDTVVYAYETRGYGQVFLAQDTIIRAITIWRPAEPDSDAVPRQVVITEVDSTGRPNVREILLHGPILRRQVGDGVHPVEYRFELEPPLVLPRRGRYFFDIIIANCIGPLLLLASKSNPYPDGQAWFTFGNRYACGYPTHPTDEGSNIDLIFKVEFCDTTTLVRQRTWGELKLRYR